MSNLRDAVSERNIASVDVSRPSTSSTLQPLRSKSSANNKVKENKTSPSKKSSKKSTTSKHKQGDKNNSQANTSVDELTSEIQNLNVSQTNENVDQGEPQDSKKKPSKKKERIKRLNMPESNVNVYPQFSINNANLSLLNGVPVQEYFVRSITPMYGTTSSSYMENMTHHPQFQFMNSAHIGDMFQNRQQSAPNTPLVYMSNKLNSPTVINSPHIQSEPSTPKYLQNVMQHPLLSQAIKDNISRRYNNPKNSPSKKKKPNKNIDEGPEDRKFEPYMSAEEVEQGLKNNTLIEGVLRINPKQFQHAYVSSSDRSEQDILIEGLRNRNRSLEGDVIVVKLIEYTSNQTMNDSEKVNENEAEQKTLNINKTEPENTKDNINDADQGNAKAIENEAEQDIEKRQENVAEQEISKGKGDEENKQKRGRVVFIKEKVHTRTCIGNLKLMADRNRQKAMFIPRDHRIPRLNIPFTCWPDNFYNEAAKYENTLFLAKIEDWYDTRFAIGKITCNIGQSGDMITETRAILAQNDLDITPFGPEVRHLYPRLDYTIPDSEIEIREDCRKLCVFSIDPPNCRDIDDAVSCVRLENGNYEIGVHISDVTNFLTENTLLDEKVADKATTIYLVEKAYHMLPDDLCMLCSLFPGVDKLAFSVFWEINENAEVLGHRFSKTIIHSCAQLAYDHAQAILEDRPDAQEIFPETYNGYEFKDIQETIKTLGRTSAILRKKRFDGGALKIDQPKVSFKLSTANGLPETFWLYENKESHQLIEEFMLLANMTVAQRIYDDHPNLAFLRSHPAPSPFMMKQLAKSLKPMGIHLDISTAGTLQKSLMEYVNTEDIGRSMVLNMLCAKPMTRAKYLCAHGVDDDDFQHYALNVPLYTHFTSPIRRYADIMVHRLLAACINFREKPNWNVDKVRMVAAQCNKQKYNAKKASEMSTELYILKYIELHSPVVTEAVVVDVREKYIDTIIVAMGLNRRIFFNNDFPGEYKCIKNEAASKLTKMELTWKKTDNQPAITQTIEVFSILKIELVKGDDINMVKVETKLIRPQ